MCANVVKFGENLSYILSDKKENFLNRVYSARVTLQQYLKECLTSWEQNLRLQAYVGIFIVPLEFISDANDIAKAFISLNKH